MVVDFKDCKSVTKVKDKVREVAFSEIVKALSAVFGEDAVSVIGSAEIAVGVDGFTDPDGFAREVCFTVKPVVKEPVDKVTASGKKTSAFDRLDEAEAFAVAEKEKKEKAEADKKAKAEKKARDEKARAEAKAKKGV